MQGVELLALFGWFAGWLVTKLISVPTRVELPRGALIKLPRLLFAVFGWPAVAAFPVGIVVPNGAMIQVYFTLLVFYRFLVDDHWSASWISSRIGLTPIYVVCIVLIALLVMSKLIVDWMHHSWPFPS
jgi:hypothetical protein